MSAAFEEALKSRKIYFQKNVVTATLSTFGIGGICAYLVEPNCLGELTDTVALCRLLSLSYAVIGRASNVLFDDEALPKVIVRTTRLDAVKKGEDGLLLCDCGASLQRIFRLAATLGFSDLLFASGIPGTVGGSVYMNAGAYGSSIGELVKYATAFQVDSCKIRTYFNKELNFNYRSSDFQRNSAVILQVALQLSRYGEPREIVASARQLAARRAAAQPLSMPSAGSTFLRTENGESMGKIIDELGLKGLRCGNAAVSEKHAGFIVNLGGATASDVRLLILSIQEIVEKKYGFRPVPEIRYITEKET